MLKDVLKNLKQHCMSGISYMIPVIVIGGFCTALARLAGNVDTAGTIGYAFLQAGNAAFALMMSVLCAGIAYSICGKPGIAPGVVAGYLSTQVKASFLGALICGILIGIMILWMQEHFPDSKALKSMYPIVIYPVISGIIATLLIMFVFGPPLASSLSCSVYFLGVNTSAEIAIPIGGAIAAAFFPAAGPQIPEAANALTTEKQILFTGPPISNPVIHPKINPNKKEKMQKLRSQCHCVR